MKKEVLLINGHRREVTLKKLERASVSFEIDGENYSYRIFPTGEDSLLNCQEEGGKNHLLFYHAGQAVVEGRDIFISSSGRESEEEAGAQELSPMPGRVLKILVKKGDRVKTGDALAILEAMKMEHTLKASAPGVVELLLCREGERVEAGVELVKIAREDS